MIFQATKCDGCGKVKGEANHWLVGAETVVMGVGTLAGDYYGLARMDTVDPDGLPDVQHFCGMQCALKRLDEHLDPPVASAPPELEAVRA